MLWGLCAAAAGSRAAERAAHDLFELLQREFVDPRSLLPRHSASRLRRTAVSFGAIVYFLRSVHGYARLTGDTRAEAQFESGVRRVIEIHGSLFRTRCFDCELAEFEDPSQPSAPPRCEACGGRLRPAVVWFGEMIDPFVLRRIAAFIDEARRSTLAFLAVGTSGAVYPAAGLVHEVRGAGGQTWLVNAEPPENRGAFRHFVQGPSGKILPDLFEWK